MIFRDLNITILKQFDGVYNYFNPSHFNGMTIFRRETKHDNHLLVSDIIDDNGNLILEHYTDDHYLYCFEDARLFNESELGVCVCIRPKNKLSDIVAVSYKKYNSVTKKFVNYKTQNSHFEKHWQFHEDKIIYHVNPYTILDNAENIIYKNTINWVPWITRHGAPGLSTNVFEVDGKKYLLFHSYIPLAVKYFKYYVGILRLSDNLIPLGYAYDPLFEANKAYSSDTLVDTLWQWRDLAASPVVKYEVIFPMSVVVNAVDIIIYAGMNDCSAVTITIAKSEFNTKISNTPFIMAV